jgi:8-oxo-dGTP pyrophosphatase MutT (NUDIX family)
MWEGPGGEVEDGETFEQAAIREFREELGIAVQLDVLAGEFEEFIDPKGQAWEAKIFTARISDVPVIQEPTKCVGFGWFTKAEVAQLREAGSLVDYIVRDLQTIGWL